MKFLKNRRVLVIITVLIVCIAAVYYWERNFHRKFSPPREQSQQARLTSNEIPLVKCAEGDSECAEKNERTKATRLSGNVIDFARHQCDGPRACPTPVPEVDDKAVDAIKEFTKDPKLEVVRITGVNQSEVMYYCTEDNKCWTVQTKTFKVNSVEPPK